MDKQASGDEGTWAKGDMDFSGWHSGRVVADGAQAGSARSQSGTLPSYSGSVTGQASTSDGVQVCRSPEGSISPARWP